MRLISALFILAAAAVADPDANPTDLDARDPAPQAPSASPYVPLWKREPQPGGPPKWKREPDADAGTEGPKGAAPWTKRDPRKAHRRAFTESNDASNGPGDAEPALGEPTEPQGDSHAADAAHAKPGFGLGPIGALLW